MTISSVVSGLILTFASAVAQGNKFDELAGKGDLAFTQGRFGEAEKAYLEALRDTTEAPDSRSRLGTVLNALATIYNLQGRYKDAESFCRRALSAVETGSGAIDPAIASTLSTLASVEIHLGEFGKAEQTIERAITIRQQFFRDHDAELVAYYTTLGVVLCAKGECRRANQVVEQALRLCETSYVDCQTGIATARTTLGVINVQRKRYAEAEEWYRGALNLLETVYGSSNALLVPVLSELASLYVIRKRYSEAEAAGSRTLVIAERELADSDAAAKAALAVGQAFAGEGRLEAAEPYFKQALAVQEQAKGPESIGYAMAMQDYARFLRKAKRSSEAGAIEMHANAILNRVGQKVDISEFPINRTSH